MKNAYLAWIIGSVLCSSLAHFSLKLGALSLESNAAPAEAAWHLSLNRWLVLGGVLHATALVLWVIGLKRVELSVAYPFIALGFVLVGLLSWTFLNETLGVPRLVGMLLIAFGVAVIART